MSEAELLVLVAACELVWISLVRLGSEALPSPGERVNDRHGGLRVGFHGHRYVLKFPLIALCYACLVCPQ